MSFRGGGGRRGGGRGGGGYSRGGGGRGRGRFQSQGPPAEIVEAGAVMHGCENDLVCLWEVSGKVPYFNAPMFLQNKQQIGKVDEILGKVNELVFTIKMDAGVLSTSFQKKDSVFIGTDKLMPLERFTNPSTARRAPRGGGRGGRGGGRGGRGGGGRFGGGRGGPGRFGRGSPGRGGGGRFGRGPPRGGRGGRGRY